MTSLSETLTQDILDSILVILPYNIKNLKINDFAKLPKPRFLHLNRIQNLPIGFATLHENRCSFQLFDRYPYLKVSNHPKFKCGFSLL